MITNRQRLVLIFICMIGFLGSSSFAQATAPSGGPESTGAATKAAEPTGHEGHAHSAAEKNTPAGQGVKPTTVLPVPTRPGTQKNEDTPAANSILLFKETTVSTGEILDLEPVEVEFSFKNIGSQDLIFNFIKPACGCTVPEMEMKAYAPGESGTMKVTFDPSGKRGPTSRVITIYTNSQVQPVHSINVHSIVKPVVMTDPKVLAFDLTQKGQSQTKDLKVYGRFDGFKVTRATVQDPDVFHIEVIDGGKVEKDGDDLWLQIIRVTILDSAKPDSHRTEISIRTNDEHKPIFSMAVVGRVIGDLQLTPVRMTIGRLVVGDEFEREVTLSSKSGKAFEIKSLDSINVAFDAAYTATPVDPEKRDVWTIKVAGKVIHPAQRFNAQINLITDVPDEETLTIQMYGQLQPKSP